MTAQMVVVGADPLSIQDVVRVARGVDVVDRILSDFKEGRQNVAEFRIQFTGRFVHIRYFAVRNEAGKYLGTLEVTQNVGAIRALAGERRLLEHAEPAVGLRSSKGTSPTLRS